MKDRAAILSILSVQKKKFCQIMNQDGILRSESCEYELKNNSIYFEMVFVWQIQLNGLIEEHLDLDSLMVQQVLKSTYLYKSCLKSPY